MKILLGPDGVSPDNWALQDCLEYAQLLSSMISYHTRTTVRLATQHV